MNEVREAGGLQAGCSIRGRIAGASQGLCEGVSTSAGSHGASDVNLLPCDHPVELKILEDGSRSQEMQGTLLNQATLSSWAMLVVAALDQARQWVIFK